MATFNVPVLKATTKPFLMQVDLDGANYNLRFRYNARDGKWRLTLEFESSVLIRSLVLVESEDLFSKSRHVEKLPPGDLIVRDMDGLGRDPDGETFGDRVLLLYREAE